MGNSVTAFASDLRDFADLVQIVAGAKNIPPGIIEKDYYVIRALRALRESLPNQFVLKGGTSLSKGWNLLERFSEDIDLLFRVEKDNLALSKGELDRRMKNAQAIVGPPKLSLGSPRSPGSGKRAQEVRNAIGALGTKYTCFLTGY